MIERYAARALLLTAQEQLLLIKIIEPKSGRGFWLTPGGGIDSVESTTQQLRKFAFMRHSPIRTFAYLKMVSLHLTVLSDCIPWSSMIKFQHYFC